MTRRCFLIALSLLVLTVNAFAQTKPTDDYFTGRDIFEKLMQEAKQKEWRKLPMGQLVGTIGMTFVGTPYVAHTFELFDDQEVCVINLAGVDCATFYEASLALARTIKTGHLNEKEFKKQITLLRYRGGKLNGYVSRLHYASDYFYDNERKGTVRVITGDLPGAALFTQKVSFMSQNPGSYRQLKANPTFVPLIAKIEDEINARRTFFLPTDKIADDEQLLQTGDIVGLTTHEKGLDITHTGMCFRDADGVLRFLNASSLRANMKVVLGPRLSDVLKNSKVNDGIMVIRPLEL